MSCPLSATTRYSFSTSGFSRRYICHLCLDYVAGPISVTPRTAGLVGVYREGDMEDQI